MGCPKNCLYGGSGSRLMHGSMGPPESTTKTVSRSVQRFCRAHDCDGPIHRQTDRRTGRPTDHTTLCLYSVTIGRIYVVLWFALQMKWWTFPGQSVGILWRPATSAPPPLPGITRCSSLKILGITVTSTLSVAEHVQDIIKLSSQTLHALRILRSHGMWATVIQHVFRQ